MLEQFICHSLGNEEPIICNLIYAMFSFADRKSELLIVMAAYSL